jgi:NNP family nitrate/nitrite transporter-like MFS transporter
MEECGRRREGLWTRVREHSALAPHPWDDRGMSSTLLVCSGTVDPLPNFGEEEEGEEEEEEGGGAGMRVYDVKVDPAEYDRATEIKLRSFKRPHMRAFHMSWIGFFLAFISWFSFPPLMKEVKSDLGLTKDQVSLSTMSSIASAVVARVIVGPLCDAYGARYIFGFFLMLGAVPTALSGTVQNTTQLCIIRFFIGILGATFVCNQAWTSQMFATNVVGTANALTAGWGNLGGGVAQVLMVGIWELLKVGVSSETAWRLSFLFPALLTFAFGAVIAVFAEDCPRGNYAELINQGELKQKSKSRTLRMATMNVNTWILSAQYAACFGVEITFNTTIALYFSDKFDLGTTTAGIIASLFGLTNLFARALGGILSDRLYASHKIRGRVVCLTCALFLEGILLLVFSSIRTLGPAIFSMVLFSVAVQAAEGCTFALVPHIMPSGTGSVTGIVGAGGNFGALCYSIVLYFWGGNFYFILGFVALAASLMSIFIVIPEANEKELRCPEEEEVAESPSVLQNEL